MVRAVMWSVVRVCKRHRLHCCKWCCKLSLFCDVCEGCFCCSTDSYTHWGLCPGSHTHFHTLRDHRILLTCEQWRTHIVMWEERRSHLLIHAVPDSAICSCYTQTFSCPLWLVTIIAHFTKAFVSLSIAQRAFFFLAQQSSAW